MKRTAAELGWGVVIGVVWGFVARWLMNAGFADAWGSGFIIAGAVFAFLLGFFSQSYLGAGLAAGFFGLVTSIIAMLFQGAGFWGFIFSALIPALVCAVIGFAGCGAGRLLKAYYGIKQPDSSAHQSKGVLVQDE